MWNGHWNWFALQSKTNNIENIRKSQLGFFHYFFYNSSIFSCWNSAASCCLLLSRSPLDWKVNAFAAEVHRVYGHGERRTKVTFRKVRENKIKTCFCSRSSAVESIDVPWYLFVWGFWVCFPVLVKKLICLCLKCILGSSLEHAFAQICRWKCSKCNA